MHFLPQEEQDISKEREVLHQINASLTVRTIMKKIRENFPCTYSSLLEGDFIQKSRTFVDSILSDPEKLSAVLENLPDKCENCGKPLKIWKHRETKSFLLTLGHIKEVKIKVKVCEDCKLAVYPDFFKNGLIFAHNKFLLTIEFILDTLDTLKNGGSLIQTLEDKLKLFGKLDGIEKEVIEKDVTNNSVKIEKLVIGIGSILVTSADHDSVTCLLCGNCPKIVCTDGNTKDSIKVAKNMIFDYDDESEIPDLDDFKDDLIEDILSKAMFQHKSDKKYNMLNIPLIMPKCVLRKQINNDKSKRTIMEKKHSFTAETLKKYQELVESKAVKISGIKDMTDQELQDIGGKLGILSKKKGEKKSGEILRNDLIKLSNIFLGGQVRSVQVLCEHDRDKMLM